MWKLSKVARLSWCERLLLLEAVLLLTGATLAIACVPFRQLVRYLGVPMQDCVESQTIGHAEGAIPVAWAVRIVAWKFPWVPTCFARALAAKIMLRRRGISSTLYLGVACDTGAIHAHAWLRSGGVILTGGEVSAEFRAICWFS